MLEEALRGDDGPVGSSTSSVAGGVGTSSSGSSSSNSNQQYSPDVAATMMLNFIQSELLPPGGATGSPTAEQRFFRLYGLLMERIFGPLLILKKESADINNNNDQTNRNTNPASRKGVNNNDDDEECRHKEGGWLATEYNWNYSRSSSNDMNHRPRVINTIESDPVVKLLGGAIGSSTSADSSASNRSNSNNNITSNNINSPSRYENRNRTVDIPQLLPTLMEAMSKEADLRPNVMFYFPFHGFSKAVQDSWISIVKAVVATQGANQIINNPFQLQQQQQLQQSFYSLYTTDNDIRLLNVLLRNAPQDQREIITHIQQSSIENARGPGVGVVPGNDFRSPRQPFNTISPTNARPFVDLSASKRNDPRMIPQDDGYNQQQTQQQQQQQQPVQPRRPHIVFDMLEYYLFLFIRFPLSKPVAASSLIPGVRVHRAPNPMMNRQNQESYGDTLYYHLFRRYLRFFLRFESSSSSASQLSNLYNNDPYYRTISFGSSTLLNSGTANNTIVSPGLRESELFLRIIIALWLESPTRLLPTATVIDTMNERRLRATGMISSSAGNILNEIDLDASFDLVQTNGIYKYDPPPMQVSRCLRSLIVHAILDPAVKTLISNAAGSTTSTSNERTPANNVSEIRSPPRPNGVTPTGTSSIDWCLTSSMTALQTPVYNYIRSSFRHASVHAIESPFYEALKIWLIWLEPWNATQVKKYTQNSPTSRIIGKVTDSRNFVVYQDLKIPREKDPSMFDTNLALWEPYVAANLYMYLVPLAILLRRSREFDFSSARFDRSIQTVRRVFRVFSPSLIQVIVGLLDKQNSTGKYIDQITLHERNLGPYAPPVGASMSLSSCRGDMQSLLEEIDMQHTKRVKELDVIDRFVNWVEGWFGKGVVTGEEKVLDNIMERAKLIVNLPLDYEFIPRSARGKVSGSSTSSRSTNANIEPPYRNPDGTLTDYGRQQLLSGAWKCTVDDVVAVGDSMKQRAQSYEIVTLVTLTNLLSDYLNDKFSLGQHRHENGQIIGFRFNLRFLADYRNLLFAFAILILWKPRLLFGLFLYLLKN